MRIVNFPQKTSVLLQDKAACGYAASDCLDTVVTNAVIIDYTGIFKADIGIKGGVIVSLGKAGNPDIMDGVSYDMVIGVSPNSHCS